MRLIKPRSTALLLLAACSPDGGLKAYNNPPIVIIESPATGSSFADGEEITFEATVSDSEMDPDALELTWHSTVDGELDNDISDSAGSVTYRNAALSPGEHTIILSARDDRYEAEDEITITITDLDAQPSITILSPSDGDTVSTLESTTLQAVVSDLQDVATQLQVYVEDNGTQICALIPEGSGVASCSTVLTEGEHDLLFTVVDLDGYTTDEQIRVTAGSGGIDTDDLDGDGYTKKDGDCDDENDAIHPDADEICGDGVDNNCDGSSDGCGLSGELSPTDADVRLFGDKRALFGVSVSQAGDVNGDGNADVIVGATFQSGSTYEGGAAYVYSGPLTGDVSTTGASAILYSEENGESAGWAVSDLGDVDGDGYDDIIVGAVNSDRNEELAGAAFLLTGPLSGEINLSDADAIITGQNSGDSLGKFLSSVGSQDADGWSEIVVSSEDSSSGAGKVYLFNGMPSGETRADNAAVIISGDTSGSEFGKSFAGCDVNGDGSGDLWIGESGGGDDGHGAIHFFAGPHSTATVSGADHTIEGESVATYAGYKISCRGDLDGDGTDDVIISAPGGDSAAYAVYGSTAGPSGTTLADADVRIYPDKTGIEFATAVAGVGDIDGDGTADFALGSYQYSSGAGQVHVFSGSQSGSLGPSDAIAVFTGGTGDFAGYSLSGIDDMDNDGQAELLIGAYLNTAGGVDAGAAYIIAGEGM